MFKLSDNDILREGEKIGWIEGNGVFDAHTGEKLGYFSGDDIYDRSGRKVGYMEGNSIKTVDGRSMRFDETRRVVSGGGFSDIARGAIRVLFGE